MLSFQKNSPFLNLSVWSRFRDHVILVGMIERIMLGAPTFLIAVPQLVDPNFFRSVVLLVEHSDEGSMGIVVNRPIELEIGEFCASQDMSFNGDATQPIFQGGPVQTDRAFILHESGQEGPETETVMGDIRLSYSLESLSMLVEEPPEHLKVFLGYAGWGEGQLAEEVTTGAWLVAPADVNLIFQSNPDDVWELALHQMGIDPLQLMHSGSVH